MATRLYGDDALPNFTIDGYDAGWTDDLQALLSLNPIEVGCTFYKWTEETSGTVNRRLLFAAVSPPLSAQTIAGDFKICYGAYENDSGANCYGSFKVTLRKPDGTIRATLLDLTDDDVEFNSSSMWSRAFGPESLTSQDAEDGDCIVVEFGIYFNNKKTTTFRGYIFFKSNIPDSQGDAAFLDDDSGAYNDYWLEFSQTLVFLEPPTNILVEPPIATMTLVAEEISWSATGQLSVLIPKATMTLMPLVCTGDIEITEFRQEINMLCHVLSATSGNAATSDEIVQLDDDYYPDGVFYFEVVGYTSASISVDIKLRRKGTTTDDATVTIPEGTTAPRVFRSTAFTPPTVATEYVVYIPNTSGATKIAVSARIVILQKAPKISKTESQYEIGNHETGKSNTTVEPLDYPKYFKMAYGVRSSEGFPSAEVAYKSSGGAVTITLQEDDGAFAGWTDVMKIVDGGTSTSAVRVRAWWLIGSAFNYLRLNEGKHYRLAAYCASGTYDIYCAKIICRQGVFGWRLVDAAHTRTKAVAMSSGGRFQFVAVRDSGYYNDLYASGDCGESWVFLLSVYVDAIKICMDDTGKYKAYMTSYLSTEPLAVKTSDDYGQTWTAHSEIPSISTAGGICCSRSGQFLYVITRPSSGADFILSRSEDYGASFDTMVSGIASVAERMCCDDTGQYVAYGRYTAGDFCVNYSSDYGETWDEYNPSPGSAALADLESMSRDGTHLFVEIRTSPYTHKVSHDRGETWETFTAWRPSGYSYCFNKWLESNNIWWARFSDGYTSSKIYRSTDSGANWTKILPPENDTSMGNLALTMLHLATAADGSVVIAGSESTSWPVVWRKVVDKMLGEYLLENTYNNSTGLANHDSTWEPSDWRLDAVSLRHVIDTSADAGDSAKLQTDPNGTPADITDSTATGAYRAESSAFDTPGSEQTIDVNVLDAPVYASKLLAYYCPTTPITVDVAVMTLTPLAPTIYPLKLPVPAAAMTLTGLTPGFWIPPQIFAYPPTASMELKTRSTNFFWNLTDEQKASAASMFRCVLTGAGDGLADITIPISYFQAILTDIDDSYVSCTVPDVETYEPEIDARRNGEIVIYAGYRLPNGIEITEEILRLPFADMTMHQGGRRESISLSGRGVIEVGYPKERVAQNVAGYKEMSDGKRKVTCDIDFFLRCGDTLIYGAGGTEYFFAGQIEYMAGTEPLQMKMDVTEL